ncbi:MAG: tRNA (N6-threonylcarbamoyladenosine(37)-N6)-methyltransferase TrmO [Clostridia bacterium]|nr:tRNA (N6-threonylcarbamoyladenosine(37)-N6)-methyltransferase TrmO [Clostridia bacterium]
MTELKFIARIRNGYSGKFGIPRQSGLDGDDLSEIVFEKPYRQPAALKGIEGFSHLWLLWYFSEGKDKETWTPTVRPPRLGGNTRVGVFATRSPNRPNRIGLSCVKLDGVKDTEKDGLVLLVRGADLMNGTPIFDIKPYLSFCDSYPDAKNGFAEAVKDKKLTVTDPQKLTDALPKEERDVIVSILEQDPRPSYHNAPDRIYSFEKSGYKIRFSTDGKTLVINELSKTE